ncbi:detoxifying efflux carrier 35 [Prunus dulcis]|uniref:Detoxifying efflux carrier 35 n=1 Tax=Prunus dulcis TaxID=3755 RepID=A0A4Y1RY94_PRUDU|nr:detoxifying efflux carrier 35 [Prunus dulcis]
MRRAAVENSSPTVITMLCMYGTSSAVVLFVGHIGAVELSALSLLHFSRHHCHSLDGFLLGTGSALETLWGTLGAAVAFNIARWEVAFNIARWEIAINGVVQGRLDRRPAGNIRVAIGGGWQAMVAYINLGCYYIFGHPLGHLLGYTATLGVSMICGTALQTLLLLFVLYKTNWNNEMEQATKRVRKWGGEDITAENGLKLHEILSHPSAVTHDA